MSIGEERLLAGNWWNTDLIYSDFINFLMIQPSHTAFYWFKHIEYYSQGTEHTAELIISNFIVVIQNLYACVLKHCSSLLVYIN